MLATVTSKPDGTYRVFVDETEFFAKEVCVNGHEFGGDLSMDIEVDAYNTTQTGVNLLLEGKSRYECTNCGAEFALFSTECPDCGDSTIVRQ